MTSQTHQCDLVSALDQAPACRDRCCAHQRSLWSVVGNSVGKDEAYRFFNTQLAVADATFFHALSDPLVWALVFLPGAQIGMLAVQRARNLFVGAAFFKCRTHIKCRTFCRQHKREQALASPPANAREVSQRRAFHQDDGIERVLTHQLARALLAFVTFVACDRSSFTLSRLQPRNRLR